MTTEKDLDARIAEWRPDLVALLIELRATIANDYRASEDPDDTTPAMQITIATDDELSDWTYQTGDNSYTGACYSYPHWGVGSIARADSDEEIANAADALLDDMAENWASSNL